MPLNRLIVVWLLCLLGSIATFSSGAPLSPGVAKRSRPPLPQSVRERLRELQVKDPEVRMDAVEHLGRWMRENLETDPGQVTRVQNVVIHLLNSPNPYQRASSAFVLGLVFPIEAPARQHEIVHALRERVRKEVDKKTGPNDLLVNMALERSLREMQTQGIAYQTKPPQRGKDCSNALDDFYHYHQTRL